MRTQKPDQQAGKPGMTLDEVASAGDDAADAGDPLGDVVGRRLEDDAVTAGHDQSRDMAGGGEKGDDRSVGMADKVDGTAAQLRDVGGVSAEVLATRGRSGVIAAAVRGHQSPSVSSSAQLRPGRVRPGDRAMHQDHLRTTPPPANDQAGVMQPLTPAFIRRPLAGCDHRRPPSVT